MFKQTGHSRGHTVSLYAWASFRGFSFHIFAICNSVLFVNCDSTFTCHKIYINVLSMIAAKISFSDVTCLSVG